MGVGGGGHRGQMAKAVGCHTWTLFRRQRTVTEGLRATAISSVDSFGSPVISLPCWLSAPQDCASLESVLLETHQCCPFLTV